MDDGEIQGEIVKDIGLRLFGAYRVDGNRSIVATCVQNFFYVQSPADEGSSRNIIIII
jgi:hypothetical protein